MATTTSRSPHTHHRSRQTCADQKSKILAKLKAASPHAVPLDDLRSISARLGARISELRAEGWEIETVEVPGSRQTTYALQSLKCGTPTIFHAALTLHVPAGGQAATARTHESLSGHYQSDLLDYAASQALKAYLHTLGRGVVPKVNTSSQRTSTEDFEGGVW